MDRMNRNTATAVSALELEELVNASGGVLTLPKKRTAIMIKRVRIQEEERRRAQEKTKLSPVPAEDGGDHDENFDDVLE